MSGTGNPTTFKHFVDLHFHQATLFSVHMLEHVRTQKNDNRSVVSALPNSLSPEVKGPHIPVMPNVKSAA
jgi:hypothetical protein